MWLGVLVVRRVPLCCWTIIDQRAVTWLKLVPLRSSARFLFLLLLPFRPPLLFSFLFFFVSTYLLIFSVFVISPSTTLMIQFRFRSQFHRWELVFVRPMIFVSLFGPDGMAGGVATAATGVVTRMRRRCFRCFPGRQNRSEKSKRKKNPFSNWRSSDSRFTNLDEKFGQKKKSTLKKGRFNYLRWKPVAIVYPFQRSLSADRSRFPWKIGAHQSSETVAKLGYALQASISPRATLDGPPSFDQNVLRGGGNS